MEQYIPKSALVAGIEKLMNRYDSEYDEDSTEVKAAKGNVCHEILCTIDTLEVKEVDLEKYYHEFLEKEWFGNKHVRTVSEMMAFTAVHFFELGMAVSIKEQKGEEV